MKIAIASDHRGYQLKKNLIAHFRNLLDLGCDSEESVDYPDFAQKIAQCITDGKNQYGILICGSGIGMSIAANRFPNVRAALCLNEEFAKRSRIHNNANVLVLAADFINTETAIKIATSFLANEFEGGRHQNRIDKLRN